MARPHQIEIPVRIVVDKPVVGVAHSLQSKEGGVLEGRLSGDGEPLAFGFSMGAPDPKFFGDRARREGPERRFV